MMKTDNLLTAMLDEELDNVEDLNAKYQLVKELNSYFSNKVNQLQSQMDIHQKNVNNVNRQTPWTGICSNRTCTNKIMNTAYIVKTYGRRKKVIHRYQHLLRRPTEAGWMCINCHKHLNNSTSLYANIVAPSSSSPAKLRSMDKYKIVTRSLYS